MVPRRIAADSLRRFVEQVFLRIGYPQSQSTDASNVLIWASLRGVDTHGVRNLKPYYVDRTRQGILRPDAEIRIEKQTDQAACLDGGSGLGLACACHAMRLAIEKSRRAGLGIVCVKNTHHLGPAGCFAHMAAEQGMLGVCVTGHFFGAGHSMGVAPIGTLLPMLSTNPLSFAAPCGRHAPFVLDMSTSVTTINRIEMYGQEGRPIPTGWARDVCGKPTTNPEEARVLLPLGGAAESGGFKGAGLAMVVSILSGVLSGAWARTESASSQTLAAAQQTVPYNQPTMGHFFAALRIDAFQPIEEFRSAMDAMIDALHRAPTENPNVKICYPGEVEFATAIDRSANGIPVDDRLFNELSLLAEQLELEMPEPRG
jgi:LDH2 family malate/lactate/ureidoglycolate dehydrogenase